MQQYQSQWFNAYGPLQMAPGAGGSMQISDGILKLNANPFTIGADFSVYDHLKYFAASTQAFSIPNRGSVMYSADMWTMTSGVNGPRTIHGTYMMSGLPYVGTALESQQAFATINLIDFYTGQLFDWFVYGNKASALAERLPSVVTGSPLYAGRDHIYTQIIQEFTLPEGMNTFSIRYNRSPGQRDWAEFLINGEVKATVTNIGIPLDKQGISVIKYPSLGNGEILDDKIRSLVPAHGLFSLLDEFPFQHPETPELNVSIPMSERLFGQGIVAHFDNIKVMVQDKDK